MGFLLGIVLLGLGVLGLFMGCRAHFTLPPVVGALPALVGWGIVKAVYVAWNEEPKEEPPKREFPGPG